MNAMLSSKSNSWYTPSQIIDAVRQVLGGIDVDPCTDADGLANTWIKATTTYDISDNGLKHVWPGRAFVNPPYGKTGNRSNQEIWFNKLYEEYQAGHTTAAIFLGKSVVGEEWFKRVWEKSTSVALLKDLLRFVNSKGEVNGKAKSGTALFYLGPRPVKFEGVFEEIAWLWRN